MIKFNDFHREYLSIKTQIDEAIQRVLESGWFILGKECEYFEREFASYSGSRFAVGVNSGTDALFLAIRALNIGPGDEVITVSHTMIATVDSITRNGARAVMVDIEPRSYNIDIGKVREAITVRTKAILPVDLYGNPSQLSELRQIADENNLYLIEDASQAAGSELHGRRVGSFADITAFSLYPTKNLGAYGDAGIVVTNNREVSQRLKMLRNYGQEEKYDHVLSGINSRLDEIQSAILRVKLKHLDLWNDKRRDLARIYYENLKKDLVDLPTQASGGKHVYHLYVIRSTRRDLIMEFLRKKGIPSLIHYPVPVHKQPVYLKMGYNLKLPETEKAAQSVLSLPIHPFLSTEDIEFISSVVNQVEY